MLKHFEIFTEKGSFFHYAHNKKEARKLGLEVCKKFGYTLGYTITKVVAQ